MSKHTPGPWEARKSGGVFARTIIDSQCVVGYAEELPSTVDGTREANARLIAAAPELLAALERIVLAWRSIPESHQVNKEMNDDLFWSFAESAIAKAKGE